MHDRLLCRCVRGWHTSPFTIIHYRTIPEGNMTPNDDGQTSRKQALKGHFQHLWARKKVTPRVDWAQKVPKCD